MDSGRDIKGAEPAVGPGASVRPRSLSLLSARRSLAPASQSRSGTMCRHVVLVFILESPSATPFSCYFLLELDLTAPVRRCDTVAETARSVGKGGRPLCSRCVGALCWRTSIVCCRIVRVVAIQLQCLAVVVGSLRCTAPHCDALCSPPSAAHRRSFALLLLFACSVHLHRSSRRVSERQQSVA